MHGFAHSLFFDFDNQPGGDNILIDNVYHTMIGEYMEQAGAKIAVGSAALGRVLEQIEAFGKGKEPVLVTGESGVGKELVARAIHARSCRPANLFKAVNCAALPASTIEDELFGHAAGSFTGSIGERKGLFRALDGGTVLLDEITEQSQHLQAALLRVLEGGDLKPVGSDVVYHVDVRIICTTNLDIESLVRTGRFRKDLFYRLAAFRIHVPPLRSRKEDIPLLAVYFLERINAQTGCNKRFGNGLMQSLISYHWPGNVRELLGVLQRAHALEESDVIDHVDIGSGSVLDDHNEEKEQIIEMLARCGGKRKSAARLLGISESTLRRRMAKYGIQSDRRRASAHIERIHEQM